MIWFGLMSWGVSSHVWSWLSCVYESKDRT